MKIKQLQKIVDVMSDNMMNDVSKMEDEERLIKEFRQWVSLSFAGGLIEFEDYDTIKAYGESKIKENFKNW